MEWKNTLKGMEKRNRQILRMEDLPVMFWISLV